MNTISTHILDISLGKTAPNVEVTLEQQNDGQWSKIGTASTDSDGRIKVFSEGFELQETVYRLTFETSAYFDSLGTESFYPFVQLVFEVRDANQHYHVPLLLSPFGYSTYRGS